MPRPYFINKNIKLHEIIRVNHAGEFGAKRIYEGQIKYTKGVKEKELISHMLDQELIHLKYFEEQMKDQNTRPTILMPIWDICGYWLGAISAKISNKTAMLVTEAIEEVIESHYQEQVSYLEEADNTNLMLSNIKKFQQDEINHKNTAIKNESQNALFSKFLSKCINYICQSAIYLSKKI